MTPGNATAGRMGSSAMLYMHAGPCADEPTRALGRVASGVELWTHNSVRSRAGRWMVCLVTETYPPEINGAAMTLGRWCEGLRDRGHLVSIVRPRRPGLDQADASRDVSITLVPGTPVPGYPAVRVGWPARWLLERTWMKRR